MSAYYDLYETSDPKEKKEEYALSEGALQGITDELCELLSDGNIVELRELSFLSTSLKCLREATPEMKISCADAEQAEMWHTSKMKKGNEGIKS